MKKGKTMHELLLGEQASYTKTITNEDVVLFAKLSGDNNPLHLDEAYAKTTRFKQRVAHGHYVASMFSTLLGTTLPGEGCIYLSQEIKYVAPVFIDDTITATVEVIEKDTVKNRVTLSTTSINQHNHVVIKGKAVVMPSKEENHD